MFKRGFSMLKLPNPPTMEFIACQICYQNLTHQTLQERQQHYDSHFMDDVIPMPGAHPPGSTSQLAKRSTPSKQVKGSPGYMRGSPEKENRFWYPSQAVTPPSNFTPGLIPVLRKALLKSHSRGLTQKAVLCYDRTVHIATEFFDLGWGCGYRNFLMASTALMDQPIQPMYFPLLDSPRPPGVRHLQQWIEDAWAQGYDPEGAMQLGQKLYNTRKWIGTAELHVAYTSRGVPCQLVDFNFKDSSVQLLLDWVVEYFTHQSTGQVTVDDALRGASPVIRTDLMPLILQHAGHSRTIIGYEKDREGVVNLLLYDPAKRPSSALREAALASHNPNASTASISRGASASHNRHHLPRSAHRLLDKASRVIHGSKRARKDDPPDIIDVDAEDEVPSKRPRGEDRTPMDDDNEIVCIDVPLPGANQGTHMRGGHTLEVALEPVRVIKFFKVTPKQLGKKEKYQILYFPLTEPLTERERLARRIVTSQKIC